jgi:hypothetical protein
VAVPAHPEAAAQVDAGRRRANARAVAAGYAMAAAAVLVVWAGVVVLSDAPAGRALAIALFGVGGALVVTGGNAIERLTTLASSQWGVSVGRHRELIGREYSDIGSMTSLGLAVLVGLPVLVAGALLL